MHAAGAAGFEQGGGMKCRKQSHSMALFSPRVPTSRKVYPGRSRNTFVYWSFLISAAGFEKSLFFWPNACYTLRRSDCPIPCKGTDLQPSSRKVHLKLILSNTPARGQTKMPFSVFAQWRQKRAFFIGKNRCLMFGKSNAARCRSAFLHGRRFCCPLAGRTVPGQSKMGKVGGITRALSSPCGKNMEKV